MRFRTTSLQTRDAAIIDSRGYRLITGALAKAALRKSFMRELWSNIAMLRDRQDGTCQHLHKLYESNLNTNSLLGPRGT